MTLREAVEQYPLIIMEGSIIERLKREFHYPLDEFLLNARMLYVPEGKILLENIYTEYIDIALSSNLPIILLTPTWRTNKERTRQANVTMKEINAEAFIFLDGIRKSYGGFSKKIFIGGLTGCKGDAYKPEEALTEEESFSFHKEQMEVLAYAGVDVLFASTLPALSEAKGIAKAMSKTNVDYVISIIIRENGNMLDGTSLTDAIRIIDNSVSIPPLFYLTNCIHPNVLHNAFLHLKDKENILKKRLFGIQANASSKSPEVLDTLSVLDADSPLDWAKSMVELKNSYRLKILGGCCGTDARFISCLVDLIK